MNINRLVALKSGFEVAFLSATLEELAEIAEKFEEMIQSDPDNDALKELQVMVWLRHAFLMRYPDNRKARYTRQEAEYELQTTYDFATTLYSIPEIGYVMP